MYVCGNKIIVIVIVIVIVVSGVGVMLSGNASPLNWDIIISYMTFNSSPPSAAYMLK